MAFNVNEFRTNLVGDGARPNLFDISFVFPTVVASGFAGQKMTVMAKSAQLPGVSIGTVPVNYFGRELKFAGNRTFTDWTVTIINDEDFEIRRAFEDWSSQINSHVGNLRATNAVNPTSYQCDGTVRQYAKSGGIPIKVYKFVGLFPTDISPIDLDWGSNDTIEEFTVTFSYQWWESNTTDNVGIA